MTINLPYGKGILSLDTQKYPVKAVVKPQLEAGAPCAKQELRQVLLHPLGARPLRELSREAKRLLIITSDHTRPLPSSITLPLLLESARQLNPEIEIRILVASGCHRAMNGAEMLQRFGKGILNRECIVNHDAFDSSAMVNKGVMPSGQELYLNKLVDWADLVIAEGVIEPHFFAGFSGGRKSVLPGIAYGKSVYANHCAAFIASDKAVTGNLEGNPIHRDMVFAAEQAKLRFIFNVVLDSAHNIVAAFAGDPAEAHAQGCAYVAERFRVEPVPGDIVLVTNGGYPLDQNIYQAVKGMTAAEACAKPGGVIIMVAECSDGHGGEAFFRYFSAGNSLKEILEEIEKTPADRTKPDQWQAQILARVAGEHKIIMVTDPKNRQWVEAMQMGCAESLEDAIAGAKALTSSTSELVVIPDGVAIIPH